MKAWQKWFYAALISVALSGTVGLADETEQRIAELDQKIKVMERRLELAEEATGEEASFKGVNPRRPLNPAKGQWGAWEVAARLSGLNVDKAAFPTFADPKKSAQATATWGVDANWRLSKNTKLVLDYEQSSFDGGAADGDREDEKIVFVRAQVSF
ncbi:MAG: porin [Kiritimatiellia bacterium]|jgi:phosphate-selective porin